MFLVGIGLGTLLTSRGCRGGKARLPGMEQAGPARPGAKREPPGKPTPKPPSQAQQTPPAPAPPSPPSMPAGLPRVALVIDDLGYAPPELVTRLCAQPVAFDVSILPYQEFTHRSAEIARDQGKEVMLHLPMEPRGYPGPGKDPGPDAVMFDLTEAQVRARVRKALADIPYRKGVNNHMGSRITPDQARMTWVLEEVKAKQCFFVDSRTEKDSVAYDVARDLAVPTVQRQVFLDDDKAYAAIARQWDRALALARSQGQVLAIGHIYPETVEALEKLVPAAKGKVSFVFASALVK
jgi:hypothetical protein